MTGMPPVVVWEFVADAAGRRRLLTRARFTLLAVGVVAVAAGWRLGGLLGGLIALAVVLLVVMVVESWGRSAPDAGPQRMWIDGGALHVEGPDLYVRDAGAEAFEHRPLDGGAVLVLDDVVWASVYPSTTRDHDAKPTPPPEFHLVVDTCDADGVRRCIVFDRRIPFRIPAELDLVDAVRAVVDQWREPSTVDAFGELDERRLADWHA